MTHETDFPGFAGDIAIPAGFRDISFGNDATPTFACEALECCLAVDHPDPDEREYPDGQRFMLLAFGADGQHPDEPEVLFETDDWAELEAWIEARRRVMVS